ncbi:glycosyltransferase family protein [Streptomyces pseudovenezuelae]|uniref:hypothetical protein n=1 Tax=Streptomyces pseudovenezuelae TaxID=67350 RepID=UPI0036E2B02A
MKALVLSGGAGTRSRPSRHASAGRPVPVADQAVPIPGRTPLADAGDTRTGALVGDTPESGPAERPQQPRRDRARGTVRVGTPVVHDAVRAVEPSRRGELETLCVPRGRCPVRGDHGEVRHPS